MKKDKNLIWLDLEMTGLDSNKDVILEIATVITDSQLQIIAQGPDLIINQPNEKLEAMHPEVKEIHAKFGLIDEVKKSTITIEQAEKETLSFFKEHCDQNTALLAGNSIWQDKYFLMRYMPRLVDFCFYRILDVSAIKEVVNRWYPKNPHVKFKKKETHRALNDALESIEELRHYRRYFFVR